MSSLGRILVKHAAVGATSLATRALPGAEKALVRTIAKPPPVLPKHWHTPAPRPVRQPPKLEGIYGGKMQTTMPPQNLRAAHALEAPISPNFQPSAPPTAIGRGSPIGVGHDVMAQPQSEMASALRGRPTTVRTAHSMSPHVADAMSSLPRPASMPKRTYHPGGGVQQGNVFSSGKKKLAWAVVHGFSQELQQIHA